MRSGHGRRSATAARSIWRPRVCALWRGSARSRWYAASTAACAIAASSASGGRSSSRTACHGSSGAGDGPTAAFLYPRPRDYRRGLFKFTSTAQGDFVDPFNQATGGLVALDAATGKVAWQVNYPKINVCGVTVANDVVFSMALDGVLHAYEVKTGKELWSYQAPGGCNGSPAVAGDLLVVPAATPFLKIV